MKNKSDADAQERLERINQVAEEAGLPPRIKLPNPIQLAQIAAGFGTQAHPAEAVRKAVSIYLRAVAFVAKHNKGPVLDVARACDNELASELSRAVLMAGFTQTRRLEPDKPNDAARRHLREEGLSLNKAKSVLENLREMNRLIEMNRFLDKLGIPVTWKNGKPLRLWGTPIPSDLGEDQTKLNEAHKAKCRMATRKEYDDRIRAIATQHGWSDANGEREWKQLLARITEPRADGRVVYLLPSAWLGQLLDWKKSLKHTGGVKSRQAKESSKSA